MRTLRRWWRRLIGTHKYEERISVLRHDLDEIASAYVRERRARVTAEHRHAVAERERDAALDAIGRITLENGPTRVNTWRANVSLDPALGAEVIELLRKRAAKRETTTPTEEPTR